MVLYSRGPSKVSSKPGSGWSYWSVVISKTWEYEEHLNGGTAC